MYVLERANLALLVQLLVKSALDARVHGGGSGRGKGRGTACAERCDRAVFGSGSQCASHAEVRWVRWTNSRGRRILTWKGGDGVGGGGVKPWSLSAAALGLGTK